MNKLMARIFAVVMVVVMLGTVSFAAEYTVNSSYASGEITTNKATDAEEAVETVLAFATDTATATAPGELDEIIAIEQAADVPEKINIVAEKIAEYDYIIVVFSGANGNPEYARIDNRDKDVTLEAITIENYTYTADDGTVYTGVAKAKYSFEAEAEREVAEYGFRFTKSGSTGTGAELKQAVTTTMSGKVTFSAAIVGVPDGVTLIATPYILYK